jgi:hypothetical protein
MGNIRIKEGTAPSTPPSGYIEVYVDGADGHLKQKDDTGTVVDLTTAGSGESNTASNVGTSGVGVFKQKTGVDLEFKKINAGSNKVTITDDTGNDELDIDVAEANINHDNLSGFVSNEHIDHSTVSISAGEGLTGGGTIASNRTIALDVNGLTQDSTPDSAADYLVTYDASAGVHKKVLIEDLPFSGGGTVQSASNVGSGVGVFQELNGSDLEFHSLTATSGKITITDNGDTLDFEVDESQVDHDSLSGFVANEHIDWTSTSSNLTTSGTVDAGKVLVGPSGSGTEELQVVSSVSRNAIGITTSGTGDAINISHSSTGDLIDAGANYKVASTGEVTSGSLTASRALVSGASKQVQSSTVTSTELGHLSGVTSAVQTQLDAKVPSTRQVNTSTGLTGGGNLSADRTLSLDINGLTASTVADADTFPVYDDSAAAIRKMPYYNIRRFESSACLENIGLSAVHTTGTLVITMHSRNGTALSATNPGRIAFRSTTGSNGTYTIFELTSNVTLTVPSGATLGGAAINGEQEVFNIYAVNNGTNTGLAITRSPVNFEEGTTNVSLISTSSDSAFGFYGTANITNAAIRHIGVIKTAETTWGTWTTNPSNVSVSTLSNYWGSSIMFLSITRTTTQSIPNNTETVVQYNTDFGPNFSVTTGAGWNAQSRVPGYCTMSAIATFSSTTWVTGTRAYLWVYINGTKAGVFSDIIIQNGYTGTLTLSGVLFVRFEPGSQVQVRIFHNNGSSINTTASGVENNAYIFRGYGFDV